MKHLQSSYITGYVTIRITGERPERFIQACIDEGMMVWNMNLIAENVCQVNIKLKDIKVIQRVKNRTAYKVSFTDKKGYPFIIRRLLKRKEIIFGLFLSFLFIIFLSNVLWKITITGVSKEMEQKITEQLYTYGIKPGTLTFSIDSPGVIQQNLTEDLPNLLWLGVQKKGTTFIIEGIEKTIVTKDKVEGPRNLVAHKKGVIKKIYVSKGVPKVKVNDYVEPGKILVSGVLKEEIDGEDTNEQTSQGEVVAAEAEITAHTWYETSVTIPLAENYELLTGKQEKKHHFQIGSLKIPIWGFGSPAYENTHIDVNEHPIYFLKWKSPFSYMKSTISEKEYHQLDRTVEAAVKIGIDQAKHDLELQLGVHATIISYKVLQQSIENGKVNLKLHIVVEEDIVKEVPINQGD